MYRSSAPAPDPYDVEMGSPREPSKARGVHGSGALRGRRPMYLLWLTVAAVMVLHYFGSGLVSRQSHLAEEGTRESTGTRSLHAQAQAVPLVDDRGEFRRVAALQRGLHHHSQQIGTDLSDVHLLDTPSRRIIPVRSPHAPYSTHTTSESEVGVPLVHAPVDNPLATSPRTALLEDVERVDVTAPGGLTKDGTQPKPTQRSPLPQSEPKQPGRDGGGAPVVRTGGAGSQESGFARNDNARVNQRAADAFAVGAKHVGFIDLTDAPANDIFRLTHPDAAVKHTDGNNAQPRRELAQPGADAKPQDAKLEGAPAKTVQAARVFSSDGQLPLEELSNPDDLQPSQKDGADAEALGAPSRQPKLRSDTESLLASPDRVAERKAPSLLKRFSAGRSAVKPDVGSPHVARPSSDESIRCRMSNICDHQPECTEGGVHTRDQELACTVTAEARAEKVKEAISWAWKGYEQCAWGRDELQPLTCGGSDWFELGLTLVDSLDTLILAGLNEEAERGKAWVRASLSLSGNRKVNVFETTIRVLGGLLAAFHLSHGDRAMLHAAVELALRLLTAFDTPSGLPMSDVDLGAIQASMPVWTSAVSLSEATTLSIEFSYVAQIANRPDISEPVMRVWELIRAVPGRVDGLAPIFVESSGLAFQTQVITFGARGDSYYEYMLKQWVAGGKRDAQNLEMYVEAMRGMRTHLLCETAPRGEGGLPFVRELLTQADARDGNDGRGGVGHGKMDHLACFLPGVLALGHLHGVETATGTQEPDINLAQVLMHSCYQMYKQTAAGLAPEIVHFKSQEAATFPKAHESDTGGGYFDVKPLDKHNLLRPETLESLFVLWRVTRNETYRDWGWQIFRAFEMHARHDTHGYTNLDSVLIVPPPRRNKMESFFIAETLKYAYLLFADVKVLPLDEYVFNTEAHPIPILNSDTERSQREWYLTGGEVDAKYHGKLASADLKREVSAFRARTAV